MANDKQWQRRSDEWVKMTHDSRRRKEAEQTRTPSKPDDNSPSSNTTPKRGGKAKGRQR